MIKKLFLRKFQSIRSDIPIELKPLTILCGPNSAGKSSLGDALELLSGWYKKSQSFAKQWENIPVGKGGDLPSYENFFDIGVEFSFEVDEMVLDGRYLNIIGTQKINEKYLLAKEFQSLADKKETYKYDDYWDTFGFFNQLLKEKASITINLKGYHDAYHGNDLEILIDGEPFLKIEMQHGLFKWISETEWELEESEENPGVDYERRIKGELIFSGLSKYIENETNKNSETEGFFDVDQYVSGDGIFHDENRSYDEQSEIKQRNYVFREFWMNLKENVSFNITHDSLDEEVYELHRKLEPKVNELLNIFSGVLCLQIGHLLKVPGNRSIVDSTRGYAYSGKWIETNELQSGDGSEIAKFATSSYQDKIFERFFLKSSAYRKEWNEKKNEGFCNISLKKYMHSLGQYRIQPIENEFSMGTSDSRDICFLYIFDTTNDQSFRFDQVGSGLSCIAPILCAYHIQKDSYKKGEYILLVEQPELHLHPKAQCEIADVLLAGRVYDKKDPEKFSINVIETHSENLILRLCRRMRETTYDKISDQELKLTPDDVVIYYFEPNLKKAANAGTKIHKIRFDQDGEFLDKWPEGFFAERQDEYPDEWWDAEILKKTGD